MNCILFYITKREKFVRISPVFGAADRIWTGTVFTPRDFHATLCCHSRLLRRCSPDFIFAMTRKVLGTRRKVSTRSLAGFARYCPKKGVSPNLTRFIRKVSLPVAQNLSPLCLPVPPQRQNIELYLSRIFSAKITKSALSARLKALFWRRHPDLNRGIRALQALALPLGYSAA